MPDADVTRRDFLKQSGLVAGSLLLAGGLSANPAALAMAANTANRQSGPLKGFIVADAHFGWVDSQTDGKEHPERSHAAMKQIMRRFPDLDVFLDTGDAFHNGAADYALEQWTECLFNEAGTTPFFFTVGNHELGWVPDVADVEERVNILGSLTCRPYYSFDLKGIHFIAVPELILATVVSRETMEWLRLDLELNRDKTTILTAHNSIKGTTLPQDDMGYRRLINSEEVFELLLRYPNVIAWMHGHQHTFEMVPMAGKVFVSCGRIGGFDPRYGWEPKAHQGMGHMGGIYFEISPDHALFRAYSATQDKFFDEIPDHQHLTHKLAGKTSLDPSAAPTLSYGAGNALAGQRYPVLNHCVSASGHQELFFAAVDGAVLNENPDLRGWCQRTLPDCQSKHIPGFYIQPGWGNVQYADESWQADPAGGFRIYPYAHMGQERWIEAPGEREGLRNYYRCVPGHTYEVHARIDCETDGQRAFMKYHLCNNRVKELATGQSDPWTLHAGPNELTFEFKVPKALAEGTIYADPTSDVMLQMNIELRLPALSQEVVIRSFEIRQVGAADAAQDMMLLVDGKPFRQTGPLKSGAWSRHELSASPTARRVVESQGGGNRRLVWLVRQHDLRWQVRNATVAQDGDSFMVGPLRSRYSKRGDVMIAPLVPAPGIFVSRLRQVDEARITPGDGRKVRIEVTRLHGNDAEIELIAAARPARVKGASWNYDQGKILVKLTAPGSIVIEA